MNLDAICSIIIDIMPVVFCLVFIKNFFSYLLKFARGDYISENDSFRSLDIEYERTDFIGYNYSPDNIGFFENN